MAKLPNLDEGKVISIIQGRLTSARNASTQDFTRFARYYDLFRGIQSVKNYEGLANLFVPEPYRIVRKKTAKLANAIKTVAVIPETENDVQTARAASNMINWLRKKLNWFLIERAAIQESRITGMAWIKCLWLLDKEEKDKPWKGFDMTMHSVDQVLIDDTATILDVFEGTYKWLINRYEADLSELEKNPNYDQKDLDMLKKRGGGDVTGQDPSVLQQARFIFEREQEGGDQFSKRFEITEYWGTFEVDGEEDDYLIVLADRNIILRMEKNPYKDILDNPIPFVPIVANPLGQELYPVGDIEPAEKLFNELNDTRNQRMDVVTFNIDPPKEILNAANINEEELLPRRGWYYHSDVPNGIRWIPPDMQGVRAAIEEERIIRGDIAQVTGILDFSAPGAVQPGLDIDTARGTIIAKGEADVLVADEIKILKVSLNHLYRIILAFSQTFLDKKFTVRVLEDGAEQFHILDKKSIQGNFDLDVEMKTLQDTTTSQQLKLLMLNQAKTIPGANIGKFFVDVLESFQDNVNIAEYYQPPQPPGPVPPKISIGLRGELNEVEVDEIYKTIPGVDPAGADPLLRESLRELMKGPEELAEVKDKRETKIKQDLGDIQIEEITKSEVREEERGGEASNV